MKTILVTGGAGFIGAYLIQLLLKKTDCRIINLDCLTYAGDLSRLKDAKSNPRYIFERGDIRDCAKLSRLFDEYDISSVIHCAAESHVERGFLDPALFFDVNTAGTQRLLDAARKYWLRDGAYPSWARFVHVSTDEVYGDLRGEGRFVEESPLMPNHPYAASKAAADLLALSYFKTYAFPLIITRGTNTFGPGQHCEKLIPAVICALLEGRPPQIHGSGTQSRDWMYIGDHCNAIFSAFERGRFGEIYNIAANEEHTVTEMVKLVQTMLPGLGRAPVHVKDRLFQDNRFALSSKKAQCELNWKPQSDFTQALESTVQWYRHG